MQNTRHIKKSNIVSQSIFLFIIYVVVAILIPIILYLIYKNLESDISYEARLSFFGSYIGGVLGGLGTLLAMYITLKSTIKIQNDNKQDLEKQIAESNSIRDKERKNDNIKNEQDIRRKFANDIARLLGVYIANISNYHYSSVFLETYVEDKNKAYAEMNKKYRDLDNFYINIESNVYQDINYKQLNRLQLEYEKSKLDYQEKFNIYEENKNRANRMPANEALFTIDSLLTDIIEAESFINFLHDIQDKSGTKQDKGVQIGTWMESSTKKLECLYGEFREKYIEAVVREDNDKDI